MTRNGEVQICIKLIFPSGLGETRLCCFQSMYQKLALCCVDKLVIDFTQQNQLLTGAAIHKERYIPVYVFEQCIGKIFPILVEAVPCLSFRTCPYESDNMMI
ncbi:hypothetical protein BW12_08420 [Bifidobacterium sp. UTCIF-3]|nr:hypothetical protein BW09_06185 [Bifidobacterium sp. UTCIF-1]TPF80288.1 hypothetical protein BW08_05065 [Bifidobacterium sp. UTCIF-24]TPF81677.1 hypothetical protein BW12_08420 [Bifidobacterium sp. UTCIF-3]TPF84260.1 hypothetical protein BW07_05405 [Bifidobacterium sp. UTCIF-36]TPF89345.1 hypothetical protein BW10_06740 [Bifidobacterium sp. UTBIF-56]